MQTDIIIIGNAQQNTSEITLKEKMMHHEMIELMISIFIVYIYFSIRAR